MTKTKIILAILVVIAIIATTIWIKANPLRRSNEAIREKLISEMPLGSSESEVLEHIAQHEKWILVPRLYYGESADPRNPEEAVFYGSPPNNLDPNDIAKYYWVIVGNYRTPPFFFVTSVSTYWRFDDNGRLFDVVIRKDTDAW